MTDNIVDIAGRHHDDAAGWDPRTTALDMVRARLVKIEADRVSVGLPRLVDADMTVHQRANGVKALLTGPLDAEVVAGAAAQCVALLVWLLRVEDASPYTGDAA